MELSGAVAIVSGGAGGLGDATVRRLAAEGMKVMIADLAEVRGRSLADDLGDAVRFVRMDVTNEESVSDAIVRACEMGPLRVCAIVHGGSAAHSRVVNRAGIAFPLDDFRRTIEMFLTGTFNVLSKAAAAMVANEPLNSGQRGVVITTASIAGYEGSSRFEVRAWR